jgi:predicted SAM-dependent methyltransferase
MASVNSLGTRIRAALRVIAGVADTPPPDPPAPEPVPSPAPLVTLDRYAIAANYLTGEGIEIGALHLPLAVPPTARVRYVDRMTAPELRTHYPELASVNLVDVDIIDDGECLKTIASESQDFVIANHFLEHCQDPIATVKNLLRTLRMGGILYMAIPDKRFTFDRDRPVTPIEHILRDHAEGPAWSKRQHFEEWTRLVNKVTDEEEAQQQTAYLLAIDYSVHYHVWTQVEILEFLIMLRQRFELAFDIEATLKNGFEYIVVLRKL